MPYINTCQTGFNWGGMGLTSSSHPSVCRRRPSQFPLSRPCCLSNASGLRGPSPKRLSCSGSACSDEGRCSSHRGGTQATRPLTRHKLRSPHVRRVQSQSAPLTSQSPRKPRSEIPPPALSRHRVVVPRTQGTQGSGGPRFSGGDRLLSARSLLSPYHSYYRGNLLFQGLSPGVRRPRQ